MTPPVNPVIKFTYDDYLTLGYDDQRRYEIIEGDIYVAASPSVRHQLVAKRVDYALTQYVEKHDLGIVFHAPLDIVLSETNVVQPDVLFISKKRMGIIKEAFIGGPPDLVIEVTSPSNEDHDRKLKRSVYSRYGVREYWIVDPVACNIEQLVYRENLLHSVGIVPEDGELTSKIVTGFTMKLAPIFAPL